jgi:hypothetical protein
MIEMEMGQEYIADIICSEAMLLKVLAEGVVAVRVVEAEELVILLIAHAGIYQYLIVAMLYQQAAHSPAAHVCIISRVGFLPHSLWHHAMHSAAIQLKVPGIYGE